MHPQVLFKNRRPDRIATLDEYRAGGGYEAVAKVVREMSPQAIQQEVGAALLLGRGGAAFPTGLKLQTLAEEAPFPRYVVCNADEMEPGTFKDRVMIHADPHMLIEGMIIVGFAAKANQGIIFIRPEYESAARILEREIGIARKAGFLGSSLLGSGFDFEIDVHRSGGRYICGEVTAQLNALEGRRPNPRCTPPYPTETGLWGQPTVLQNVETFCCVPHIVANGSQWFKDLAVTASAAGTKIFSISGKVRRPGCYELPLGVPLSEIIEKHAGGMTPGSKYKACLPGGASTGYLSEAFYHIPMDFESLKEKGHRLGTGAIMVFDQNTCLVGATVNLMEFFKRESCGWCTPCREGIPYIHHLLERIENGMGHTEDIDTLEKMCRHLYSAFCAFAPGAAAPVESLLHYFRDEVRRHIELKKCPFAQ